MSYTIAPSIQEFKEKFQAKYPEFKLDDMDWLRCSFAMKFATGKSVLEVGPGVGMMIDALTKQGMKVSGVDLGPHSRSMFPDGFKLTIGSITDPALNLAKHTTVVCMEVLEHLDQSANKIALANLRYAAEKRIVMTVPYNEREPLWHHDKPGGHRQKFTVDKAAELFPNAYATIIPRYNEGWLFIVEDKAQPAPFFTLVSRTRLAQIFSADQ